MLTLDEGLRVPEQKRPYPDMVKEDTYLTGRVNNV